MVTFSEIELPERMSGQQFLLTRGSGVCQERDSSPLHFIEELQEKGIFFQALAEEVGRDLDPFDLICHVAIGAKPLTRRERALNVRKRDDFTQYGEPARAILDALLDKYADEGIQNLERMDVLKITPFDRFGSPVEIIKRFGGKNQYAAALRELEAYLYEAA